MCSNYSSLVVVQIECKGEAEFHSVINTNCEQEGKVLHLDEQVGSNPSSNSLMVCKVTQ